MAWMYTTSGGWGLEKLKELWALDPDTLEYIHEEEQPDIEQEEENELVVGLEETQDLDKPEEELLGLFGKRKRTNNSNSVSKRKK